MKYNAWKDDRKGRLDEDSDFGLEFENGNEFMFDDVDKSKEYDHDFEMEPPMDHGYEMDSAIEPEFEMDLHGDDEFWDDGYKPDMDKDKEECEVKNDDKCEDCFLGGMQEGYDQGFEEGKKEKCHSAYKKGFDKGYNQGYDEAFDKGIRQGREEGYEQAKMEVLEYVKARKRRNRCKR